MTIKHRRFIFYLLAVIFILLGGSIVLYAQGWRVSLSNFEIQKVGAIQVGVKPEDAQIYLDGEPIKTNSSFFGRDTFINNLFPDGYELKIEKDGYTSWKSTVPVLPTRITQFKNIILVPKSATVIDPGPIKSIDSIGDKTLLEHAGGQEDTFVILGGNTLPDGKIIDIGRTGSRILILGPTGNYLWHDVQNATSTILNRQFPDLNLASLPLKNIKMIQNDDSSFLVKNSNGIHIINPSLDANIEISIKDPDKILSWSASPQWLVWASATTTPQGNNASLISYYNRIGQNIELNNFIIDNSTKKMLWSRKGELAILQDNGALYIFNPGSGLKPIASDVLDMSFSPTGNKIIAIEHETFEVFVLEGGLDKYYRFSPPAPSEAEVLAWHDDENHIFISYPNEVRFLDLADQGLDNFVKIAETNSSGYDAEDDVFYFLEKGALMGIELPK